MQRVNRFFRGHWQLLLLCALIVLLWQTPITLPLKILTVFLHELSHALATLLTGGAVISLSIDPQQGGEVISQGGSRFVILSAGYCGSLFIGAMLFVVAVRTDWDRFALTLLGGVILVATALFVRDSFALIFGLLSGGLMIVAARYLGHGPTDLILRIIGLTSMIYVPYDIFSDTISRSYLYSDARMMAEEFGGSTQFWGGLWLGISLIVIGLCLRYGLGDDSNISLRRPARSAQSPGSDDHKT